MIDPVKLLQKLVQCKSITPESYGSIETVKDILEKLNFEVEIIEFTDTSSYPVKNLYAKYGDGNTVLGFCGHLDVVPSGDSFLWDVDPFAGEIKNGYLIGRGSEDMKGGIACFISALSGFLGSFDSKNGSIILLLTLDEEKLAINGIPKLIEYVVNTKKQKIDACILGEPTCSNKLGDTIKVGRRGSLNFTIKIQGKQGHVAYPALAYNPSITLEKILNKLLNIKLSEKNDNFEASNLEISGIKTSTYTFNVIPDHIIVKGNIRFNNIHNIYEIKNILRNLIIDHNNVAIDFSPDASEPFLTKDNSKICKALEQAILDVTSLKAQKNTFGGTSDARFLKNYTDVIEFGMIEKTLHQINEKVAIKDIILLSKIYEVFLQKFFMKEKV